MQYRKNSRFIDFLNLSRNIQLLVLVAVVIVYFGTSTSAGVSSAGCIQHCESTENACVDSCRNSCGIEGSESECALCLTGCLTEFSRCMRNAIWCDGETVENGRCQINFSIHCPIIGGSPFCDNPQQNHSGYSLTCRMFGEFDCIDCPDGEYCTDTGNLPPCPHTFP